MVLVAHRHPAVTAHEFFAIADRLPRHAQLIAGEVVVNGPTVGHQHLAGRLYSRLLAWTDHLVTKRDHYERAGPVRAVDHRPEGPRRGDRPAPSPQHGPGTRVRRPRGGRRRRGADVAPSSTGSRSGRASYWPDGGGGSIRVRGSNTTSTRSMWPWPSPWIQLAIGFLRTEGLIRPFVERTIVVRAAESVRRHLADTRKPSR